ncbi:mechanosensitive ion channel family protein [Actinoallomurus rhizosphaericola]|uniref:mechanosensitive ion channel family protein n=1 Tax=Actinoallomurus rhizosphaericola TaxID=2952536 RepID=UPI0020920597|nr:mechanosensitive ion channel domain-containing protein [Actinoallomurus rhizosphaericola]MCO5999388.1 mechanosensitive ion channel family protein [Actinoallomurus rhizosphaericola]
MSTVTALAVLIGSVLLGLLVVEILRRALTSRLVSRWPLAPPIVRRCVKPGFALAFAAGATAGLPPRQVLGRATPDIRHTLSLLVIASMTWLIIQAAYAATDVALDHLTRIEGDRNVRARRVRTQVMLLRRTAAAVVVIIAASSMLFTFPAVRAVGAGLLASAGIAGIVAGIAAQSTLSNVFAGLQLAFSDALRIDDVLVVEGQWGRIEELTLTYVVLRLWDERRLVLPVSYFVHNSFENWTRHTSRVIGTVLLHVDWSVPVEELRTELYGFLRDHPLWDQKDWVLQVTDVLPNGLVQIRALMSAHDSPSAFDLRCDVREHLIAFIREKYPSALPRFRADTEALPSNAAWTDDRSAPHA